MNRDNMLNHLAHTLPHWPTEYTDMTEPGHGWAWYDEGPDCTLVLRKDEEEIREADYLQRRTELINRPSWEDAPEWAQWLAQDESGEWFWFEAPVEMEEEGEWFEKEGEDGRIDRASRGATPAGHNWRDTPEQRPDFDEYRADAIGQNGNDGQHYPDTKTWWTHKPCTLCERQTAAKVSDDRPVCPECVVKDGDKEPRAVCKDGSPCGEPSNPDDDAYCIGCPNYDEDSDKTERTIEDVVSDWQAAHPEVMSRSKYHREVKPGVWIDVYDVLKAWGVKNPALQHLIKKALAPGKRGHKDLMTDMDDIVASAKRAREMES